MTWFFDLLYIFSVSSELRNSRRMNLFYKYKAQLYNVIKNNSMVSIVKQWLQYHDSTAVNTLVLSCFLNLKLD